MRDREPFENQDIQKLQRLLYLLPIVGFFPSTWMLYRGKGTKQQRNVSRLAVTLFLGWLSSYLLLGTIAQVSETPELPLLVTTSLCTSGYFVVNLWLMLQLLKRKPVRLPIVSKLSDRLP